LNFSRIFTHRRASAAKRDSILLAGALLGISSRGNFEFASSNSYSRIVGDLLSPLLSLSLFECACMYLISHDISDSRSRRRGDIHRLAGPARREEREERRERERKVLASTKQRRDRRPTRASRTPGAVTLRGDDSLITARAVEFPRVPSSSLEFRRRRRRGSFTSGGKNVRRAAAQRTGKPTCLRCAAITSYFN